MTNRSRQGIRPPEPIPPTDTEREHLRVLEIVAQRLSELAARRGIKMIGKGGTILILADSPTRPSTDYDADTGKPLAKPTLVGMMNQILKGISELRDARAAWSGKRSHPVIFTWRTPSQEIAPLSFLKTTVRTAETQRPQPWQLLNTEIDEAAIRTVNGMQIYTATELMRGKVSAFMGRAKGRDIYDVTWALSAQLKDVDRRTRITLDQFMDSGSTDEQWTQWRNNYETDQFMSRACMDKVMETLIDCLEQDPVVSCARVRVHPLE